MRVRISREETSEVTNDSFEEGSVDGPSWDGMRKGEFLFVNRDQRAAELVMESHQQHGTKGIVP